MSRTSEFSIGLRHAGNAAAAGGADLSHLTLGQLFDRQERPGVTLDERTRIRQELGSRTDHPEY